MTTLTTSPSPSPSPSPVPRAAERLLEALGADAELRDALLGDLAEEHAIRRAYDGADAARRWYWREALRVAPHFVRDWARRLRARDVARLAGLVVSAYVLVGVGVWVVLAVVETAVERVAGPVVFPWHDSRPDALVLAVMLPVFVLVATAGGWVAAWLDDRAPLVAALALGVAWATVATVVAIPMNAPLPAWYLVGQAAAVLLGTALGGMRRVATRRPAR